jgi:hypothetical protein
MDNPPIQGRGSSPSKIQGHSPVIKPNEFGDSFLGHGDPQIVLIHNIHNRVRCPRPPRKLGWIVPVPNLCLSKETFGYDKEASGTSKLIETRQCPVLSQKLTLQEWTRVVEPLPAKFLTRLSQNLRGHDPRSDQPSAEVIHYTVGPRTLRHNPFVVGKEKTSDPIPVRFSLRLGVVNPRFRFPLSTDRRAIILPASFSRAKIVRDRQVEQSLRSSEKMSGSRKARQDARP